jgi:hypothetical protein
VDVHVHVRDGRLHDLPRQVCAPRLGDRWLDECSSVVGHRGDALSASHCAQPFFDRIQLLSVAVFCDSF